MAVLKCLFIALCIGFSYEHKTAEKDGAECNDQKEYDATTSGTISSPLYGKPVYPNQLACEYKISAPEGYRIKITFKDFDIESSGGCRQDKLAFLSKYNETKLGVFCGSKLPNPILSKEGENVIHMLFMTDLIVGGRGFLIQYESSPYYTSVCDDESIQCRNRNCYKSNKKCDGVDDCGDGTDEENCGTLIETEVEKCGVPHIEPETKYLDSDRIVGGEEVVPHSWPWQVSLQSPWVEPNGHFCGGTLINAQWVLTATHCVAANRHSGQIRIHLGSHSKTKTSEYEQVRTSAKIISYPDLVGDEILKYELVNDMSLIKLNAPVKFNKGVQPACLPPHGWKLQSGWKCYVTGWGESRGTGGSDVLKQSEQLIQSSNNCKFNESTQVCVEKRNKSPCHGDSGGPLSCKFDGKWFVFGCASYVTTANYIGGICTGPGAMTVYASSEAKVDWIKDIIKNYA